MHQLIDKKKKLFLYLSLLFLLTTFNNLSLINSENIKLKIQKINVSGLSELENLNISKNLNKLMYQNIFYLKKNYFINILEANNLVHSFVIKKIYPNSIDIKIEKTKFLAITHFNKEKFLIGANGKLIKFDTYKETLPYFFGKLDIDDFIRFSKILNKSKLDFKEISEIYFFPSGRWNIKNRKGTLFKLPKKNLIDSLNFVYQINKSHSMNNFKIIDLRIPGKIISLNE
tara:strand:+ start:770 stop:1456 length:687 start_codon:yes stop_codon:yes gene_type:complete